jgi:predicted ATP-dependent endonuclease of OLD family
MLIEFFRIRKYRNIQDSGEIPVEKLTCIVGKNQSGKTALLRALHRFNPYEPEDYDINREWPRGERKQKNPKQVVCEVRFKLDEEEKTKLAELTSEKVNAESVLVTKDYEGNFEVQFPDFPSLFPGNFHPNDIDELCKDFSGPSQPVSPDFKVLAQKCIEETKRLAREGKYTELSKLGDLGVNLLKSAMADGNANPQHQNEDQFVGVFASKLSAIEKAIKQKPTMQQKVHNLIVNNMPTFIYMDDYFEFKGTAFLDQFITKRTNKQLTPEDQTFLTILKLSGLDLDRLFEKGISGNSETIRDRQYDLDDAARSLTNQIAGRWGQSPYRIHFRVDGQKFFTEIEENDKHIGMIPLEEQSKGFRWFFSFDLRFMHDSGGTFEGCVLLLDEPGLHLHPGGQKDLLKRLDAYAEKNTLIYTTHLPFLIDLREPSRIRAITETDNGSIVSEDLGDSGPDEKMTLQAALGMTVSQSYLVAPHNLVVEGVDVYMILTALSSLFERSSMPGLPDDVQIIAAEGASKVVYIATFMIGQGLEVVTLFDSDDEGRIEEARLREKWLTRYKNAKSNTVFFGEAVGLEADKDFAIEDLFTEHYYLKMVKESHRDKMREYDVANITLTGEDPLCNRVTRACSSAGIQFNKDSVAKLIRKDLLKMGNISELPQHTKDKAKKLFETLRAKFSN